MKNFKKYACLFLGVLILVTLLAACGDKPSVGSTTPTPASASPTSGAETKYPEDVQKIIDRGVLKVGVKNAVIGFGYQDPLTNEYSGLEITLAEKIAETFGVDVEFTAVTAATRTELLDSGDIDCVLATFTIT